MKEAITFKEQIWGLDFEQKAYVATECRVISTISWRRTSAPAPPAKLQIKRILESINGSFLYVGPGMTLHLHRQGIGKPAVPHTDDLPGGVIWKEFKEAIGGSVIPRYIWSGCPGLGGLGKNRSVRNLFQIFSQLDNSCLLTYSSQKDNKKITKLRERRNRSVYD